MKKIFLLEDEPVLLELYCKSFIAAGYHVISASSLKEAKIKLSDARPDIAFIDHGIKHEEKSGINVIKDLKELNPQIQIVMLTNYSHQELKNECRDAGANDFLIKINNPPKALLTYTQKLLG